MKLCWKMTFPYEFAIVRIETTKISHGPECIDAAIADDGSGARSGRIGDRVGTIKGAFPYHLSGPSIDAEDAFISWDAWCGAVAGLAFRRSAGLRVPPLVIPLERPSEVKKIVCSTLPALFSNQIETLQINFVINDTVYIDFQPKERRWLTIQVDSIEEHLRKDYRLVSEVRVDPDSVFIEGPSKMVVALSEPYQVNVRRKNIDEDYDEFVEVVFAQGELIKRNPARVRVSFEVEKYVNVSDTISLQVVNLPRSAQPKIRISAVHATLNMQERTTNTFHWDSLKAVVDLKDFKRGKIKLIPQIVGLPDDVTLVRIDTVHITY